MLTEVCNYPPVHHMSSTFYAGLGIHHATDTRAFYLPSQRWQNAQGYKLATAMPTFPVPSWRSCRCTQSPKCEGRFVCLSWKWCSLHDEWCAGGRRRLRARSSPDQLREAPPPQHGCLASPDRGDHWTRIHFTWGGCLLSLAGKGGRYVTVRSVTTTRWAAPALIFMGNTRWPGPAISPNK